VRRFADNIYYRDADDLFRFVTDPEIDPTNNVKKIRLLGAIPDLKVGALRPSL